MSDKLLKNEIKDDNANILLPQHPCRLCICGSSGSGKTKFTMDLLLEKQQPFDKIIWIAPEYSLKQVKMKNFIELINEKHISLFSDVNKDQSDIEKLIDEFYNKKYQTVIVIDDMMTEQNKFISNLFTQGRHKSCSIIELTQRIFTPKNRTHRMNTSYFVLFRFGDSLEAKMLFRMINPNNVNKLLDMYDDATTKKYGCFILDNKWHELDDPNKKLLRYRDTKWNTIYNVDF
jgi:excinuclease UvrABC ATPase subunit